MGVKKFAHVHAQVESKHIESERLATGVAHGKLPDRVRFKLNPGVEPVLSCQAAAAGEGGKGGQ